MYWSHWVYNNCYSYVIATSVIEFFIRLFVWPELDIQTLSILYINLSTQIRCRANFVIFFVPNPTLIQQIVQIESIVHMPEVILMSSRSFCLGLNYGSIGYMTFIKRNLSSCLTASLLDTAVKNIGAWAQARATPEKGDSQCVAERPIVEYQSLVLNSFLRFTQAKRETFLCMNKEFWKGS